MTSRRGRPTGPSTDTSEAILRAAFGLLINDGPGALTPSRLHRETGIARTTIYRNWPTPAHIVEEILRKATARPDLDPWSGDLDHDLRQAVGSLTFRFANRPVRALFDAVRAHPGADDAPSLGERYVAGLVAPVREVIEAAVARGTIAGSADDLTAELCGPLFFRHLLLAENLPAAAGDAAVEAFLARHERTSEPK